MRSARSAWRFLDDRLRLEPVVAFLREKEVPRHRLTWAYFFGGLSLFFLAVQVTTGILLLLYYRPTPEAAYESVEFVMTRVEFGWLVRSVHAWSANLMVLSVVVHMSSVYLMRSYGRPRDLTWWTGMLLLAATLGFGFSGYLLPWNTLAFFATRVGTDMVGKVPLVGGSLLRVLRGGEDVSGATLTRFFGLHAAVLPLLAFVLLGLHLLLVQRHNVHVPPSLREEARRRPGIPFLPDFTLRELVVWLIGLALLAALAAFRPWELGARADPFASAPAGIQPEWYFLFVFQTLKLLPARILGVEGELLGLAAFGAAAVLWFLAPVLDRASRRGEPSRTATVVGLAVLLYAAAMTLYAALAGRRS
ncbi:cytochrome b [Anaeromyxobacter oryzisoli]|uniref:cytochrome b n=1 Tax=Anaeromyxobacter oryzisoli TaxID=2925408 RepID=UPI001F5A9135|nr:cytochrome b N-terminal domain-containing protein [Anaeromyxobacter sp. SG63]